MGNKYVYGYAWKEPKGDVQKRYIYADSQDEADKAFEEMTKVSLTDSKIKVVKNRQRA